ncbi:MAG: membrane protein insertion efficiency factor YidD [Pseudobdellovibrionaceae bacterium]
MSLLQIYRVAFSPFFGGNCRFEPSCSFYAVQCFENIPLHKAFFFTLKRLLKCHPAGGSGYDPAPVCMDHHCADHHHSLSEKAIKS